MKSIGSKLVGIRQNTQTVIALLREYSVTQLRVPFDSGKTKRRLNPCSAAVSRTHMVELQCPHCEEDIELENYAFGFFDCPHCGEEFSWNKMKEED